MGTFERIRQLSPWALGLFAFAFIAFMVAGDLGQAGVGMGSEEREVAEINGDPVYMSEYDRYINETEATMKRSNPEQETDMVQIRNSAWNNLVEFELLKKQANNLGYYISKDGMNSEILKEELLENPPKGWNRSFIDSAGNYDEAGYKRLMQYYIQDAQTQAQQVQNSDQYTDQQKQQILNALQQQTISLTQQILDLEKQTIRNHMSLGLQNVVNAAGGVVSPAYAKRKYIMDNSTADVEFIYLNPATIADSTVEVSESDLKDYYNKNSQYFEQAETAKIQYAVFSIQPSTDDLGQNDQQIQELSNRITSASSDSVRKMIFNSKSPEKVEYTLVKDLDPNAARYLAGAEEGQIVGPVRQPDGTFFYMLDGRRAGDNEVVKASHILVNFNENKDSALVEAKNILKEVNPSNFSSIASVKSMDRGSAQQGGSLGYFTKEAMVKPFADAAFGASKGSIVGPIESQFGYHIIYVEDKTSDEVAYSYIQYEPKVSRKTKQMIAAKANTFIQNLKKGGSFDSLATQQGAMVETTPEFTRQRAIMGRQSITALAFNEEEGYLSDAIYIEGQGYVVVKVLEKKSQGIASFEDKKEEIRPMVIKEKKMQMLKDKAKELYTAVKGKNALSAATSVDNSISVSTADDVTLTGNVPGAGRDFVFTGAILKAEVGTIYGPLEGSEGVFIYRVTDKYTPSEEQIKENIDQYMVNLINREKSSTFYQWFNDYRTKAKVNDYRQDFYREF